MGSKDDDDDLPEAPPIQMILETFSQVTVTPENNDSNKGSDDKKK